MVTIAVDDTDFMMTMPKGLTASTGMDAMTHAVEAAVAKRATLIQIKMPCGLLEL